MSEPRYWFPAKRYGWGWGPPSTPQGWAVLAAYVLALAAGAGVMDPERDPLAWTIWVVAASAALVAVVWAKGEPPRRRWGDD